MNIINKHFVVLHSISSIRSPKLLQTEGSNHYTTTFEPSVKYVRYGPSYENIPDKCQDTEEQEGIYEILKGEEVHFIMDRGVASSQEEDETYDKLDFSRT